MKLKTKVCACRLYYYIILLDFCSLWFRVDVWLFVSVVCFSAQQTETISNLARCLTCWIPKRAATRSCPTGPNQHPTPPCATWRWRILCVQGEQLLSEAGLWGSGLWELLLHPTRGSPNMQDTPKKKRKRKKRLSFPTKIGSSHSHVLYLSSLISITPPSSCIVIPVGSRPAS